MPGSTVTTAPAATIGLSVTMGALLQSIDGPALFGAIVGASIIALNQRDLRPWQRISGLLVSILAGYLFAPEILNHSPLSSTAGAGAIGAVIVVPLALRLAVVIERTDLNSVLPDWLKRKGDE